MQVRDRSIFNYSDAHSFLKDRWADKKKKNPSFSMRAWAKRLGFENNAALSQMLAGKRPIPRKYIPDFSKTLGLSTRETDYLATLMEVRSAKTLAQKDYFVRRLKQIAPRGQVKMADIEAYKSVSSPLDGLLLEMTALRKFNYSVEAIQKRLRLKVTRLEITESIKRLINLGLMEGEVDRALKKIHNHLSTTPDQSNEATQNYHVAVSQLAQEMIAGQNVSEREFNGFTLNVRKSKIPQAKELIRRFAEEFIQEIEAPLGEGEQSYQLNVQFFGLTR